MPNTNVWSDMATNGGVSPTLIESLERYLHQPTRVAEVAVLALMLEALGDEARNRKDATRVCKTALAELQGGVTREWARLIYELSFSDKGEAEANDRLLRHCSTNANRFVAVPHSALEEGCPFKGPLFDKLVKRLENDIDWNEAEGIVLILDEPFNLETFSVFMI